MSRHPMRAADGGVLKICGITRADDARAAVDAGATALGFVFWPRSPRCVTPEAAAQIIAGLPPHVTTVGVFVDEPVASLRQIAERTGIRVAQLHGSEPPSVLADLPLPIVRSIGIDIDIETGDADAWPAGTVFLLDASDPVRRGGTGQTVDWVRASAIARQRATILAGGLTPDNVAEAIASVRPLGVDVSSGVEESPGVKDVEKMRRFLSAARRALNEQAAKVVRA